MMAIVSYCHTPLDLRLKLTRVQLNVSVAVTCLVELHRVLDLLHLLHSVLDHLLDVYLCLFQQRLHNISSHKRRWQM